MRNSFRKRDSTEDTIVNIKSSKRFLDVAFACTFGDLPAAETFARKLSAVGLKVWLSELDPKQLKAAKAEEIDR